jgi:hypothetical protein
VPVDDLVILPVAIASREEKQGRLALLALFGASIHRKHCFNAMAGTMQSYIGMLMFSLAILC